MAVAAPPGTKPPTLDGQRIPPNQSIYIQNLPEKLQKDDLRRELYMLFSPYSPIIDITALKNSKMRGQAHILFRDVQGATQAMRSCQGFEFFGREMKISYSKNRSDTLAKLTGTFNPPTTTSDQAKQGAQAPSSFPAPPGTAPASILLGPPSGLPPPPGLPAKVNGDTAGTKRPATEAEDVASPQGVKRVRDESDDEEAPMEEDEGDDESEMEMSEDDDD
ncbi:hypothetical protein LTR37_009009 [Vermiconidia calcicola]|uniref:Uncharacterized protein n=1 Tax=Vermiconidia calcicola TaxID=1690605 RepID=A0ACC3N8W5_9PEZI|nr:hypothetical protein LTR37_009009 [Vermiconidia calcicola]